MSPNLWLILILGTLATGSCFAWACDYPRGSPVRKFFIALTIFAAAVTVTGAALSVWAYLRLS